MSRRNRRPGSHHGGGPYNARSYIHQHHSKYQPGTTDTTAAAVPDSRAEQWDSDVFGRNQDIGTSHDYEQRVTGSSNESGAYAPTDDYTVPTASSPLHPPPISPRILRTAPIGPVKSEQSPRGQFTVGKQTSPTQDYLDTTLEPSTCLEDPTATRKLLILDLNGTLVFRSPHRRREHGPKYGHHSHLDPYADPMIQRALRPVYPRPFLPSLRDYLFHPKTHSWLDTMVWSSAQPHSVADMVERSFGDKKDELAAVWARDTLGLSDADYNRKTQTTKNLEKPWAFLSPLEAPSEDSELSLSKGHSAYTTLLLDDSPLKAHLQPWNHFCIKEYTANIRLSDVEAAQAMDLSKGARSGATIDKPSPSFGSEASGSIANTSPKEEGTSADQSSTQDSRKRKRQLKETITKKEKRALTKKRQSSGDYDGTEWCRKFDCTLLAVVGVLDAVKRESNVASWIRKGGLSRNSPIGAPLESGTDVEDTESGTSTDPEADARRNRKRQERGGNSEELTGGSDGGLTTQLWFDDATTISYWITRGLRALQELDIEIRAGIRMP